MTQTAKHTLNQPQEHKMTTKFNTHHHVPQPAGSLVAKWYRENIPDASTILHALAHMMGERDDMAEALKALLKDPITSGSAAHYRDQCKIKGRANPIELARAALAKAGVE